MPLLKLQKASRIALREYMGLDEGETINLFFPMS